MKYLCSVGFKRCWEKKENDVVETLKWWDLEFKQEKRAGLAAIHPDVREGNTEALYPYVLQQGDGYHGTTVHCGIYLTSLDVLFLPFFPDLLK